MAVVVMDGYQTGSPMKVNSDGSININGSIFDIGYSNTQIIRQDAGSPPVAFVFSSSSKSFLIDNLGSTGVYFAFNSTADTSSTSGFLPAYESRAFDAAIGSVSILGSGAGGSTPSIQVIKLS